jgi:RimJ/RimL family protein N-acetyltransferase
MLIRHITTADAPRYLALRILLDEETVFRLYEPGENRMSLPEQEAAIARVMASPNSTIIVAEIDGELVGYLSAGGRPEARIRHVTHISLAIRQSHVGQGIGTLFFTELERWAREASIHRLELSVMVNNPGAIGLYKKMGFVEEGHKRHSMLVDGEYIDEIYMAKLLT